MKEIKNTRWQHLTAEEQYSSFKEEYKDDVKAEMDKKSRNREG